MVFHRHIFGTEEADFPFVAQAEAQDEFVDEFRFSLAGASRPHCEAPRLKGAVFVQVVPARFSAPLQAVFEERAERLLTVFGGKDTLQRDFFGLFQRNEQTFRTILYQVLVGIFTFGAEVYQAAAVRSEAPYQFLAQQPSGAVLVDSDVDELLGFEVAFYEAIHPVEVALRAGGYGNDILPADGHEGCGVEFAFGDDAFRGVQYGVDVVGDKLGTLHHHEVLPAAAILGVDERAAFKVVEAEAVLLFAAFGQPHPFFGDAQVGQQALCQAAFLRPVLLQLLAEGCTLGGEDGAAEVGGELAGTIVILFSLLPFPLFGIIGHVELVAAVVAVAYALVQVDGEGFVAFVSSGVVALWADGLDFSAGAATGVDAVLMEISHFC